MDREKLEELRTRKHETPPGGMWASGLGPKITFAERDALFAYIDDNMRALSRCQQLIDRLHRLHPNPVVREAVAEELEAMKPPANPSDTYQR